MMFVGLQVAQISAMVMPKINNEEKEMVSLQPPVCEFDEPAMDFELPGVDGKNWSLADCVGEKGLLVMF
ncbi:hypothetical protein MNBD_GAMMA07-191, partial [hydrothermal vent metagenome]